MNWKGCALAAVMIVSATPASAAPVSALTRLRAELAAAKAQITAQQQELEAQEKRLRSIEERLSVPGEVVTAAALPAGVAQAPVAAAAPSPAGGGSPASGEVAAAQQPHAPIERVGQAAPNSDRPPEVAVLGTEGSVVTRKGQLTTEFGLEYARADRNQALFRGIELVESVLVGVFNISQSRQDIVTASGALRYGITDKLELGVRVPFVHRSDNLVTTPIGQNNDTESVVAAQGNSLGDIEMTARYQFLGAHGGWPYLIGNLQVVAPTGTNPFTLPRTATGEEKEAATGAGFWGVTPSITAILPTDPAVLFGTLGYTKNFGRSFNTQIGSVVIDRVNPGDGISFSGGIGISLNQRTSINLGYAHTWAFGTRTFSHLLNPSNNPDLNGELQQVSRDLQIGRFLFGMTYRVSDRASLNWSVEVGATQDAPDLRTSIRIPLVLFTGG
ncbi:hypothetical protein F9288_07360 [Sphingomonas sp. CL5.1]|uniref:hypothetical protein n=1 Tax=Sphingomonas sp. CL5.1 TaxID=2653203 RepID=UPI0015844368|nr:hypothetical protein [Sphingomonas sp. CL5.1]QKR99479.1 hypothetical protein F9288_07360 [Sphingomonas sp. CL5.1]